MYEPGNREFYKTASKRNLRRSAVQEKCLLLVWDAGDTELR